MAENFDEKNPKLLLLKKIQSNEHVLKEMPPPPTPSTWQPVSQWDDDKDFSQMSQQELDDATHKIIVQHFTFARTLARTLSGRCNQKELEKFIIQESIKELKFTLNKKKLLLLL